MACRRVLLILLGLGVSGPDAFAQVVISPYPPSIGYSGYSLGYSRNSRHGSIVFGLTGLSTQGVLLAPIGVIGPYPGGYSGGTTIIVTPSPPPITVVRPRMVVDDLALEVLPREVLEAQGVKVPPREAVPDAVPLPRPRVVEAPKPPARLPDLPMPPAPVDDPRAEHARLVRLGREAFANGEDGRAADRFRQAIRLRPIEPTTHFMLAQALFALGKYPAAADEVRDGLALRADWPTSGYRFRDAYEADIAGFVEHLHRLEEARNRFPDDPNVLFLLGYVLWFDDKRVDAKVVFRKALEDGADRNSIERFLMVP